MSKVHVFDHPLIQHKLSYIRDKNTGTKEFRELVDEVGMLMAYEVTRDLQLQDVEIETPVTTMTAKRLAGKKLAIVPILRAGLGMTDGVLNLVPAARVGHIGLYRDPKTLKAVEYFANVSYRRFSNRSNQFTKKSRCKEYSFYVFNCRT